MAKKQALSIILCICMLLGLTFEVKQSAAATPVSSEDSALLWKAKFSDPYFMGTSMISTPVVTEDAVYIVNKDALYALDPATGKTVWELDLGRRMDSICDPILVENHLYIPLTEGVIKCVDINDQKIEWVSNDGCFEFVIDDHQTLGRLAYHDGYLYAGTWKSISSDPTRRSEGYYFCVSAADGLVQWCINGTNYLGGPSMPNYTIDGNVGDTAGFYWTEPVFTDNYIFFTSEDGYLYCLNTNYDKLGFNNYRGRIIKIQTEEEAEQEDEEQEDPKPIPDSKLFRCGLSKAEAKDCNCIYAINKGGTVYRIQYDDTSDTDLEHAFNIAQKYDLFPEIENRAKINCTCTPIVDNSTFIFGAYANGNGYLVFVDDNSDDFGSIQYSQTSIKGEIKSKLLSMKTADSKGENIDMLFFAANEKTGSLYATECNPNSSINSLFTPDESDQNYCISKVVAGPDGTLYYSNDSGTIFAIGTKSDIPGDTPPAPTKTVVKKPSQVKYKKSNKKITITWKKAKNAKTQVYLKQKNKKWKKLTTTSKESYKINRKKYSKKTIYLRLRSVKKVSGKNVYSDYTKTKKIKA